MCLLKRIGTSRMPEDLHIPHHGSPFWRFSLRFYARAKISAICLLLQDEAGVDVNLLLFLLLSQKTSGA